MYFCQKSSNPITWVTTLPRMLTISKLRLTTSSSITRRSTFSSSQIFCILISLISFVSLRSIQLKLSVFSYALNSQAFLLSAESKSKHLLGFSEKNFLIGKLEIIEPKAVHKGI